ncbi:MAG TPA: acyl-CoA thioesterase [Actinomycetota bacterium]
MRAKTPGESHVELVDQMQVTDANLMGNVHGGVIMKMVDNAAGLAAIKHSEGPVVTAAMDEMSFIEPVYVGDVVTVKATVNEAFTTSMEVGVRVEAENLHTREVKHTSSAYLVFVAMDADGEPRPVPPLQPETEEERRRQQEAKLRREARLARKEAIEQARAGGERAPS